MTTKHNHQVIFGRKVEGCERCTELKLGAPARQWRGYSAQASQAERIAELRAHDCKRSGCMTVCTFGDW